MKHKGYNNVVNGTEHPYTFNGKEENKELGFNLLDYGARFYDAALGRFIQVDPLTEDYIGQSVYVYSANNPVFFQEKNGESPDTIYLNEEGETIADINDGSDAVFVVNKKNEAALVEDLIEENVTNDNQDAETNAEIGEKHGRSLADYQKEGVLTGNGPNGLAFRIGYEVGYDPENAENVYTIQFQSGTGNAYGTGKGKGKGAKRRRPKARFWFYDKFGKSCKRESSRGRIQC